MKRLTHVRSAFAQRAGVDLVAEFGERRDEVAFALDRFLERRQQADVRIVRQRAGQRMAAARLGEALDQRLGARVEEQHAHVVLARQVADQAGHFVERRTRARVDRDREPALAILGEVAGEFGEHVRRQVVDAVIACVFERVQRDGLA